MDKIISSYSDIMDKRVKTNLNLGEKIVRNYRIKEDLARYPCFQHDVSFFLRIAYRNFDFKMLSGYHQRLIKNVEAIPVPE